MLNINLKQMFPGYVTRSIFILSNQLIYDDFMVLNILLALWASIKDIAGPLVQQIISLEQDTFSWPFGPDIFIAGSKGQKKIKNLEIMVD